MAELKIKCVLLLALIYASFHVCCGLAVICNPGQFRLYNGSAPGQGMLQQCNSSHQWSAVCDIEWDCNDAKVACRQLGFNESRAVALRGDYFGQWDSKHGDAYFCSGSENSLQSCSANTVYDDLCNSDDYGYGTAGLICNPPPKPTGECTDGDLRLLGQESESEGLVEVCYEGGWYSVCGLDANEASVLCKQLGHTVYPWASWFDDGRFGHSSPSAAYIQFSCSDQFPESSWTECTVSTSCTGCGGDVIKCFDPSDCEEGSLRLVDGDIDNEGRVEICFNGVWGTVNSQWEAWDSFDAYFVCNNLKLGTSKKPEDFSRASKFGDGLQPQVMQSPECYGLESSLIDCRFTPYGKFQHSPVTYLYTPPRLFMAGILCYDDCDDSEVRLVGGTTDSEGTVEVCLENLWGLVGEAGWSPVNAQVVCKQLGYSPEDAQAVTNSHHGKPKKPVHLNNVHCTGSEEQILSCSHIELASLDEKKEALNELDVAGVICQSSSSSANLASSIASGPIPATSHSTASGPIPTGAPNNAPGNPSMSTSGDQTTEVLYESPSLVVALYLIVLALSVGLVVAIVGLVICWKKMPAPNTGSANSTNPLSLEHERGSMLAHYEMSASKPIPSTSHTPASVKTMALDKEKNEDAF